MDYGTKTLDRRIKNPTYHTSKLRNDLQRKLFEYIETNEEMNQTKLGKKLGVNKSYISQLLNEGYDHKLSNFFKLSLAIDKYPVIQFLDEEEYIKNELQNRKDNLPLDLKIVISSNCLVMHEKYRKEDLQFKPQKKRFDEF